MMLIVIIVNGCSDSTNKWNVATADSGAAC